MKGINFNSIFKVVTKMCKQHSPEILIGLGIGGLVTTTVLAVRATPGAINAIDDRIDEINEVMLDDANTNELVQYKPIHALSKKEVVKVCWKRYLPATITGLTSLACVVGGTSINLRRNAALATAYKISESTVKELLDYKGKVIETIGEEKHLEIEEKLDKAKLETAAVHMDSVTISGHGPVLYFDKMGGQWFRSDNETIRAAINRLNHAMNQDMYVSLNDFYSELDLSTTIAGESLGWNTNGGLIEARFSAQAIDGTPVMVMATRIDPMPNFNKIY